MFKKLKAFFGHPYMAPVTETLIGVATIACAPIAGFIDDVIDGWKEGDDNGEGSSHMQSMYASLFDSFNTGTSMIALGGSIIGGLGLAAAGAIALGTGGTGMLIAGGLLGLGFGVAAGPFVLAGIIATAAAAVGTVIGGVPGFIKGISKIVDYHRDRKGYEDAMQKLAGQPQAEENAKAYAPLLGRFNELSQDKREAFVRLMNKEYEKAIWDSSERIMKAVEALPEKSREKLAERLSEKLPEQFGLAAADDLADVKEAAAPVIKPDNGPMVAPAIASFRRRTRSQSAMP